MQKFYLSDADATIQKLQNQLREAQITIEEQNSTIDSLRSDIHLQQVQINELNATIDSQQTEIVAQQTQIGELNATVESQNSTINSQQSQIASQQTQISGLNATINSQMVVISSQRSRIEQLQSLLSEPPAITYVDYPLCMKYVSIENATQEDWRFLALHYKDESGSHFWWLTDGTSQIRYQYDKIWLINKRSTHFALLSYTDVHVSHAGSEVSNTHSTLSAASKYIFTQCYTDTPYVLIPIGIDQNGIRTLRVNATGDSQFSYVSMSELTSKTFPIFLLNAEE